MPRDPRLSRLEDPRLQDPRIAPISSPVEESRPEVPQPEQGSVLSDLALSPFRGAEGAGRNVIGLANAVIPGERFDIPLSEKPFLGSPTTTAGQFATSIFQFLTPFIPAIGALGKIGSFGGRAFNLTSKAERALSIAGKAGRAKGVAFARGAVAGAVADFTAFDGNEERFSNLIQTIPQLRNPVTDFLAADEEDPEVLGRIKQVIEGVGLGTITEAFFVGLRGFKAQRAGRALGLEPDAINAKIAREAPEGARQTFDDALDSVGKDAEPIPEVTHGAEADGAKDSVEGPKPDLGADKRGAAEKLLGRTLSEDEAQLLANEFEIRRNAGPRTPDDPFTNPRLLSEEQRAVLGASKEDSNLKHILEEEDPAFFIRTVEDLFGPLPDDAARPKPKAQQIGEAAQELADLLEGDPEFLIVRMAKGAKDTAEAAKVVARRLLGFRILLPDVIQSHVIDVIDAGLDNPENLLKFQVNARKITEAIQSLRDGVSEVARGLGSNAFDINTEDLEAIGRALDLRGGPEEAKRFAEKLRLAWGEGDVEGTAAAARLMEQTTGQRTTHVVTELFLNSMLSGPKTLSTNALSPISFAIFKPLENMLGGIATGNSGLVRRASRELNGMILAVRDSARVARKTFRTGRNVLSPGSTVRDDAIEVIEGAVSSRTFGVNPNSSVGATVDFIGRITRLPSRILASTDEFVKQLYFRGQAYAEFMDRGIKQGLSAEDLPKFVEDNMRAIVKDGQAISYGRIEQEGLKEAQKAGISDSLAKAKFVADYIESRADELEALSPLAQDFIKGAEEISLTEPLKEGSLGASVQQMVQAHPLLKFVAPFVRTPINIVRQAARRAPNPLGIIEAMSGFRIPAEARALHQFRTEFANAVHGGSEKVAAEAIGRQITGLSMSLFFMHKAASGEITGRGPSDKEQRDLLLAAGWQPYSFVTDKGYVSYIRMDPFATIIGTIADVYDFARLAPSDEQENFSTASMAIASALANNLTNKTYLQGIHDVIGALSEPDRKLERLVATYASTVVPNTFSQSLELFGDDLLRDAYGIVDRIGRKTPGFSSDLPPLRNMFGEPIRKSRGAALGLENLPGAVGDVFSIISPIAYREVSDNRVNAELVKLQHGFMPPRGTRLGIDFSDFKSPSGQNAYDRWLELHGSVRSDGKTLKQTLRQLISSPEYLQLTPVSTSATTSPRVAAIGNAVTEFRELALEQMLREFPELSFEIDRKTRSRALARTGQTNEQFTPFGSQILPITPFLGGIGQQ